LSGLSFKTRRLFNVAKNTGHWDTYKKAFTCYNKELIKKLGELRGCHGGGTARRLTLHQAMPDS
jgi:hypothetical protein